MQPIHAVRHLREVHGLTFAVGLILSLVVLLDAFESIVLPRRTNRTLRITRVYYRSTWTIWSSLFRRMSNRRRREGILSFFGPLSLLGLIGVWAMALILSFGMMLWGIGSPLSSAQNYPIGFATDVYFSGTTFVTLGPGDFYPSTAGGRALTMIEGAVGFAFLAVVIGYLPVTYQAFSRREVEISLLDARGGSPSNAYEVIKRYSDYGDGIVPAVTEFLQQWERWSSEVLESHLSYPSLGFFRSQHDNQSWINALTTVLDVSALLLVTKGPVALQARLTFAMGRHTMVDLSQVFHIQPAAPAHARLDEAGFKRLMKMLGPALQVESSPRMFAELEKLRNMYEPFVNGLSERLLFAVTDWIPKTPSKENWRTSAWEKSFQPEEQTPSLDDVHADS